ncbi:hypothetical protein, conserved [Eimeria brunetti]|uniref:Uncharacterized protein n=1 Tax=Eimeria brunetti TaxID=51314 RepID=U6LFE5_9EIME|nr:hypothetical protein, conserved [Eimeria brunetti]
MGGPLTALVALGLHWCMQAAPPQCKTQILMGASFFWLLFSAALFAYALASAKADEEQTPIQQLQQQHQQGPMITMPLGGVPAPGGGAAAAAAAQQREWREHQLPKDGRASGANNGNGSWLAEETTALLQDFEWHNRSSSSSSSSSSVKCLEYVAEGLNVRLGLLQQFEVQRLIPAVLLLRLVLLPLLFWLEAAPAKLLPVLRAATGATAVAGKVGLRGAAVAAPDELSLQDDNLASVPVLPASEQKQHEQLLLLLVDGCRCLWLFVFAAVHGCLSLTGTIYITHTPEAYVHKAGATRLLCLFESIGLALGTALSVAFSPPLQLLRDWQQSAATTLSHLA